MRFSGLAEAICEGFQVRVVIFCGQRRLEHYMPQGTAIACDGLFSAKGSAVVRDRVQTSESGSLFAGDGANLRLFRDQHRAGNSADLWDRAEEHGGFQQVFIARDGSVEQV